MKGRKIKKEETDTGMANLREKAMMMSERHGNKIGDYAFTSLNMQFEYQDGNYLINSITDATYYK